jgi:hypothetical protein
MALATGRVVQKRRRGGSQLPEQWLKLLRSIQYSIWIRHSPACYFNKRKRSYRFELHPNYRSPLVQRLTLD